MAANAWQQLIRAVITAGVAVGVPARIGIRMAYAGRSDAAFPSIGEQGAV
ncbi:hypothetical protein [Bifidobacterium sp.]